MSPMPAKNSSTIQVTTRYNRSLYTYLIHTIVRPFRNRLGRPKEEQPKGSVELSPYKAISRRCTITHHTVCDIHVYDIISKAGGKQKRRKRIYYFCGGGWQTPPSSQHWFNCAHIARTVADTTVSLVSYPLAPKNTASSAFPWLLQFYREIMQRANEADEQVILAGDSAGGNIVLSLALEAVREDFEESKEEISNHDRRQPTAIMAICPSTDLTRSNPEIEKVAKNDPILTPAFVRQTAKAWHADWEPTDRRVSPVNADMSLLARRGIRVHGITGGYDILGPDGIRFRDQLADAGVEGRWLHWEKQMHCFILTQAYGVREAKDGIDWVVDILKAE